MNAIMKKLWTWQARKKKMHKDLVLRYPAIHLLGEYGDINDFDYLLGLLADESSTIRNITLTALKKLIVNNTNNHQNYSHMVNGIVERFRSSNSLLKRINAIEVMKVLPIAKREELLATLLIESANDLKYQIIHSLGDTENIQILNDVLISSDTNDLILKRKALETWYNGLNKQEFEKVRTYSTENLHYLIRATYELQLDGEFLNKVLSYAQKNDLPSPKAYPDFIIRYLNELLGKWEYDPEAYRSLHAIVVPSYFTFDQEDDIENPFVIL